MSPRMSPEQARQAVEMRASGATYIQIATTFGVSEAGVRYRIDRLSPQPKRNPRHRVTREEAAKIRDLRSQGVGVEVIAARFGVSTGTITEHSRVKETQLEAPLTRLELLECAFPWSVRLPLPEREQFADELAHRPKGAKEADIDRLVRRWRHQAERRTA